MTRFLILVLAILTLAPAYAQGPFPDVLPSDPYASSVQRLKDIGVLFGYPDGTFRGSKCVTRAELAVVVARMMEYFIQSLPAGVSLQSDSPGLPTRLAQIGPVTARQTLHRNGVQLSEHFLSTLEHTATVDEVSELVCLAVAQLIERVSPAWEGGLEPPPSHDHSD
ncbi:MAG: S-layer homology domain-containing protein [Armatimonadota bacterium]